MAVADPSFTFTELLRDPNSVTAVAETTPVTIRRRGAADLVLGPADRSEEASSETGGVARLLASLVVHLDPTEISDALPDSDFAWTEWLPPHERAAFVVDLLRSVAQAASLESYRPINQTVREWAATAAIHADPELASRLRKPIRRPVDKPVKHA